MHTPSRRSPCRRLVTAVALALLTTAGAAGAQSELRAFPNGSLAGTPSTGSGSVTVFVNTTTGEVTVDGTYTGLLAPAKSVHIHGPAGFGGTAAAVLSLTVSGGTSGTISGSGVLTASETTDVLCELDYLDLHTSLFPDGEIRGRIFAFATTTHFGAGLNPPLSILVGGVPTINSSLLLAVDNPLGTQAPGSLAFLALANAPDATFTATGTGTLVPGFGMSGPGAAGELLVSVAPPNPLPPLLAGGPWLGAGNPVSFQLGIPNDKTLVGRRFYVQGLLFDSGGAVRFGLTRALEVSIGS